MCGVILGRCNILPRIYKVKSANNSHLIKNPARHGAGQGKDDRTRQALSGMCRICVVISVVGKKVKSSNTIFGQLFNNL